MLLIKLRFDLSLGTFFFNVFFFGVFEILLTKLLSDLVGLCTFLFFIVFDLGVLETLLIKLWLDLVSLIGLGFLFFIVCIRTNVINISILFHGVAVVRIVIRGSRNAIFDTLPRKS